MPIITGPAGMDPILGEMRTIDISGGTGGGGGSDYTFNSSEFTVSIAGLVSIKTIDASKITGKVGSAGVADALANSATVDEVMTGITGGTTAVVDVSGLRGALTAGQAVDVTSQPDGVAGDWKGTFNWTDSYLGFDNTFPKYASGLSYLLIADLTYSSALGGESILVTPSGTWLDGSTTAIRIDDGETKRVAMIFSSKTGKLTVDSFDPGDHIEVNHLREYEVTACSNEAIAYIAALSNPDAFASYYLVKQDMVQPWTYIIDMGTSPAVTIASGLSYKLNASTGTHQLTVDTCPAGYDGRDAIIRIRLGGTGVIQAVAPLQLGGALIPYAVNNCVVRFRDGEAVLLVEDTLSGYVVTVNSGTGEGSLPYGLAANGVPYIAFSPSTDGTPIDLSGSTTAAEEVTVVGNGYEETILTGSITCTSKTIVANLALSDVQIMGGTLTLGDAYIPQGSTLTVSSGGLAVEKVNGNGGTIDLGGKAIPPAALIQVSGVTLTNGLTTAQSTNNGSGGVFRLDSGSVGVSNAAFVANSSTVLGACAYIRNGATMTVANTVLNNNNCSVNAGCFYTNGVLNISSCTFSSNTAKRGGILYVGDNGHVTITDSEITSCNATGLGGAVALYGNNADLTLVNCYVHDNGETNGAFYVRTNGVGNAHLIISGSTIQDSIYMLESATSTTFAGTNVFGSTVYGAGSAIITSGAVVDLTGNTNATPINPGGGISVVGGCTVINSAGASVSIAGGTYTKIKNDGTTA